MGVIGPMVWALLRALARRCDEAREPDGHLAHAMGQVLSALRDVLPCVHCRTSYDAYYVQHEPPASGFSKWLFEAHNSVNHKLGKPLLTVEVWEARERLWPHPPPTSHFPALLVLAMNYPVAARRRTLRAHRQGLGFLREQYGRFFEGVATIFPELAIDAPRVVGLFDRTLVAYLAAIGTGRPAWATTRDAARTFFEGFYGGRAGQPPWCVTLQDVFEEQAAADLAATAFKMLPGRGTMSPAGVANPAHGFVVERRRLV
jgi:hypothetical protein